MRVNLILIYEFIILASNRMNGILSRSLTTHMESTRGIKRKAGCLFRALVEYSYAYSSLKLH